MNDLPPWLTVPAVLIWIVTRSKEACLKAFEAGDDEVAVPAYYGLDRAAWVIALDRQPELLSTSEGKSAPKVLGTIKGKSAQMDVLDNAHVRCRVGSQDFPRKDYEFLWAERELLDALVAKNIIAYTIDTDNVVHEIEAVLWLGREFEDEVRRGGRCPVIGTAANKKPMRDIFCKRDDVLRKWPPKGGRKRGPKPGEPSPPRTRLYREAKEMLDDGTVQPGYGALTKTANLLHERGYKQDPDTIRRYISPLFKEWNKSK